MKRFKNSSAIAAVVVPCVFGLTGLIVMFATDTKAVSSDLFYGASVVSVQSISLTTELATPLVEKDSLPQFRLKIPKINIDVAVESKGLTPLGDMDASKIPGSAAWFDQSSQPGEEGSAVIAGHYGWKDGKVAVFDHLNELQKGDKLYVEDEGGITTTFIVRETRTYGRNDDTSPVFGSDDGKSHLNLITCAGEWNEADKSYADRLVVFADKEQIPVPEIAIVTQDVIDLSYENSTGHRYR